MCDRQIGIFTPCVNLHLHMKFSLLFANPWHFVSPSSRIQQESLDGSERNRILVHFIDYAFDDWRGDRHPVYPGLCSVWRSLARSKVHISENGGLWIGFSSFSFRKQSQHLGVF